MKKIRSKKNAGFTLIEIMIVVLIIAILLAIAIPNFLRARETSRAKSCQGNMRQIETAKEQWAMDTRAKSSDTPTDAMLVPDYIREGAAGAGKLPLCPSSGTYTIGDMTVRPKCSIGASQTVGAYDAHILP
jgi:prepilin-type N-terminal cleavage/methylation domain-containing protein